MGTDETETPEAEGIAEPFAPQTTARMEGGTLDGIERPLRGVAVVQMLMREDGLYVEQYTWEQRDDGIVGVFRGEVPYVAPETTTVEEAPYDALSHELLMATNNERASILEVHTNGQIKLEHAFDVVKSLTYLRYIAEELGVARDAEYDYERQREKLIDKVEVEIAQFEAAAAKAMAMQKLGIGGGPPMKIVRPGEA